MTDLTIFRLRITGQVQGVGFRDWAVAQAGVHGLSGWVRNRSDGSVELMVAGPDRKVQDMLGACTQGPEGAVVTNIDIHNEKEMPPPGFLRKPAL